MIYNFPGQTAEMLDDDIKTLIELDPDQVIFYPLMNLPVTTDSVTEKWLRIDLKKEKKFYYMILDKLSSFLEPTTAWCFSKNNNMIDEYIVNYDEYLGLGSGSFGYLNGAMYANTFSIEQYINKLKSGHLPVAFKKNFSRKEQVRYDFLIQLFAGRLDIKGFNEKHTNGFCRYLWKEIYFLRLTGAIQKKGGHILLTRKGLYYWVIMMREFFKSVNMFRDYCRNS